MPRVPAPAPVHPSLAPARGLVALGCLTSALPFLVPPQIISGPSLLTVVPNEPVLLECNATGIPTPTLMWLKDGNPIASTVMEGLQVRTSRSSLPRLAVGSAWPTLSFPGPSWCFGLSGTPSGSSASCAGRTGQWLETPPSASAHLAPFLSHSENGAGPLWGTCPLPGRCSCLGLGDVLLCGHQHGGRRPVGCCPAGAR